MIRPSPPNPSDARPRTTRLAPSPTGDLHLGNLRTFALTWALARALGWRLLLRLEDLDAPRVKPGAVEATVELLRWIGFDHDGEFLTQSHDLTPYRRTMEQLARARRVFTCSLSRAEVRRAASAPHVGEFESCYPASLRPRDEASWRFAGGGVNHRFAVPDDPDDPQHTIHFVDLIAGAHSTTPADEVGDFVVWTRDDLPSYQLAVVVDDARQGVTDVVRGDDLLSSVGRQTLLHRCLGGEPPRWWHVPLVLDADGTRLAKRSDSRSVRAYRDAGASAERVLGMLAAWLNIVERPEPLSAAEFLAAFSPHVPSDPAAGNTLTSLHLRPVHFTEEDHRWLLERPLVLGISGSSP